MTYDGPVRREDLKLRGHYIDLNTTIFKINDSRYLIYADNIPEDFEVFRHHFLQTKIMGIPVEVTNVKPDVFQLILPPILDKDIPKNFEGMMMNLMDILNLLIGKFPKVYFLNIEEQPGKVVVKTCDFKETIDGTTYSRFLPSKTKQEIISFLQNLKCPYDVEVIEEKMDSPPQLKQLTFENPVSYIYSDGYKRKDSLDFVERDQTLWYDNIEKIFKGDFKKNDLYFYDENEYSCYVDYSSFDNIDIRNHLFLYQTVYLSLPYEKDIAQWLKSKKITIDEFLELIKRGRIKIVLNQPEFRQDVGFLKEIYRTSPGSIISRRALLALQQIDIVEISDNYIFNGVDAIKEIRSFCEAVSKNSKTNPKLLYESLVWPIKARRTSFSHAHASGLVSIPGYGVNNVIQGTINKATNKDYSLEFIVSSPNVHLANALNATYFPFKAEDGFSDYYFANLMGTFLNLYKNATVEKLKSFVESRNEINSGILPINPIDILDINNHLSIIELDNAINDDVSFSKNKKLIELLSNLSPEERKNKIEFYNTEMLNKLGVRKGNSTKIDLGSNIFMDLAGKITGFDFLGTALSAFNITGKSIYDSNPDLKHIYEKLEESFFVNKDKSNIHYLAKINRVARLRNNN